jgi:uncharacterized membrane protein
MVTLAFIIFLAAVGFARWLRRRQLAKLSVEQKAAVGDATAADAVWPVVVLIALNVFPLRFPFAPLSLDRRVEAAAGVLLALFLVSVAVSVSHQVRFRRLGLPHEYRRSTMFGAAAVHLTFLVIIAVWMSLAMSYVAAVATQTPNQAMQRTAGCSDV